MSWTTAFPIRTNLRGYIDVEHLVSSTAFRFWPIGVAGAKIRKKAKRFFGPLIHEKDSSGLRYIDILTISWAEYLYVVSILAPAFLDNTYTLISSTKLYTCV